MATEDRFLTFDVVAAMLGSAEQPFGRQFLNKLIARGDLVDNGLPHKARRISRKSVLALMNRMEEGTFTYPSSKEKTRPRAKAAPKAKANGAGKSRSAMAAQSLEDEWNALMQLPTGRPR